MKTAIWFVLALGAMFFAACGDTSNGTNNSEPEYKADASLPDTCFMEVATVDTTYFACFENKWMEITDPATVEQFKKGVDEDELQAKLGELADLLIRSSHTGKKEITPNSSSSTSTQLSSSRNDDLESSDDSKEVESSAAEDSSSSSIVQSSFSTATCGAETYNPLEKFCHEGKTYNLCNGEDYIPSDQFCDTRESGTLYKYITIGTQTWMAENLNYDGAESRDEAMCFSYIDENCQKYGHLYTWDAAKKYCPDGWILPSMDDYEYILNEAKSIEALFAEEEGGTDAIGFSLLKAGWASKTTSYYLHTVALFWVSDKDGESGNPYRAMTKTTASSYGWEPNAPTDHFSVRCIKKK